jgi:hypothetical protein
MSFLRNASILLGLSAAIGLIQASPSMARDTPFGAACSSNTTLDLLIASGGCNIGDKNFTGFSYNAAGVPPNPASTGINVSITTVMDQYTVVFSANSPGAWTVGGTEIGYKIAANTTSTDYLNTATGAFNSSLGGSVYGWTTTATNSSGVCTGNQTTNSCAGGGNPPPLSYAFGVEESVITNKIDSISAVGVQSIQNAFTQQPVPGPLPILGAGAAFGFSRKLRSRIKASA